MLKKSLAVGAVLSFVLLTGVGCIRPSSWPMGRRWPTEVPPLTEEVKSPVPTLAEKSFSFRDCFLYPPTTRGLTDRNPVNMCDLVKHQLKANEQFWLFNESNNEVYFALYAENGPMDGTRSAEWWGYNWMEHKLRLMKTPQREWDFRVLGPNGNFFMDGFAYGKPDANGEVRDLWVIDLSKDKEMVLFTLSQSQSFTRALSDNSPLTQTEDNPRIRFPVYSAVELPPQCVYSFSKSGKCTERAPIFYKSFFQGN